MASPESLAFIIFIYRTRLCPAWQEKTCEFSNMQCLDAHGPEFLRRAPQREQPKSKCRFGFGDPGNCRSGKNGCRDYHTIEELNFHPRMYKTVECFNKKCGADLLCHMYHNDREKNSRKGGRTDYDTTQLEQMGRSMKIQAPPPQLIEFVRKQIAEREARRAHGSDRAQPDRPRQEERDRDRDRGRDRNPDEKPPAESPPKSSPKLDHDADPQWRPKQYSVAQIVHEYFTRECPQRLGCNNPECFYYHGPHERRRAPSQIEYMFSPCGTLYDPNSKMFAQDMSQCPEKDGCLFAHNFFEVWYHPSCFRTYMCPYEQETVGSCPFGQICSHAHRAEDRREPESPVDPPNKRVNQSRDNQSDRSHPRHGQSPQSGYGRNDRNDDRGSYRQNDGGRSDRSHDSQRRDERAGHRNYRNDRPDRGHDRGRGRGYDDRNQPPRRDESDPPRRRARPEETW